MQTVVGYPSDLTVGNPEAFVTVSGQPVELASLSITRELKSSLPDQVTSASGFTAATGTAEWAVGQDVQALPTHPWNGEAFPPKPSAEVVAYMGYGGHFARQITGIVDSTEGSAAEGSVTSNLVDHIDKLNQPVSFPAMLRTMPPATEGGNSLPVNCTPTFFTDRILRACGFYATPPVSGGCILSVPLMGSSWPEVGTITSSGRRNDGAYPPLFNPADWGMAVSNIDATYTPGSTISAVFNRPLQLTFKARKTLGTAGNTILRVQFGAASITLGVTPARRIYALLNDTTVCEMSASAAGTAELFTLRATPEGVFTIFAGNGEAASGRASIPSGMATTPMSEIAILSPEGTGVNIGGVQVNWTATGVYNATQTAILTSPAEPSGLAAFPRVEGRNALDLLKEQAEAECAAMWIDEFGVFRWVNRNALTTSAPVATITALDDVFDLGWESGSSGVRSRVVISSRDPSVRRSNVANQFCWQGSGVSMEAGQVDVQLASPPADTDWVGVDSTPNTVSNLPGWEWRFNRGRGSWVGGVETTDDNERWAMLNNPSFGATVRHLGDETYQITTTAGNPSPGYTVELRTPAKGHSSALRQHKTEYGLPVLRAMAVAEWADITTASALRGPANAAALEHDAGPWVQDPQGLMELADWLAGQVSEPRPTIRDLNIVPDFRLQLGDIVWIDALDSLRIKLRVLITKISTTVTSGDASQTVAGRILEIQAYGATNTHLDIHANTRTNTGFDALWSASNNAALDANPLGRG